MAVTVLGRKDAHLRPIAYRRAACRTAGFGRSERVGSYRSGSPLVHPLQPLGHHDPEIGHVDRHAPQHLAGGAFDIEEAEKDMIWLHTVVPPTQRETVGSHKCSLGSFGEAERSYAAASAGKSHQFGHLAPAAIQRRPGCSKHLCGRAAGTEETQEEVLGANVVVAESLRLLLGGGNHGACLISEPLKHRK